MVNRKDRAKGGNAFKLEFRPSLRIAKVRDARQELLPSEMQAITMKVLTQ